MRLNVADVDGDGKLDIIVACKTGLYVFKNKGYSAKRKTRARFRTAKHIRRTAHGRRLARHRKTN